MKKMINVILSAALLLSAASLTAAAAEQERDMGVFVRVNFDGKDKQEGYEFGAEATGKSKITGIADGNLVINSTNFPGSGNSPQIRIKDWDNYGAWDKLTGEVITVGNYEKVTIRTRFKIDGESTAPMKADNEIFRMVDGHVNSSVTIFAKDGKLAYGMAGNTPAVNQAEKVTDYNLYKGTWYTMEVYCQNAKWYVNIIPDEGEAYYGTDAIKTGYKNSDEIGKIQWWRPNAMSGVVDYVEVVNEGFRVKDISIDDGAEDIPVYTDYDITLSEKISEGTLKAEVTDSEGNKVPVEITEGESSGKIEFPAGLKYGEKYTVTIPTALKTQGGKALKTAAKYSFTTEEKPYSVGGFKYTAGTNEMNVSFDANNKSGLEKNINVLLVSYDDNGKVFAMKNEKVTIDGSFSGKKSVSIKTAQSAPETKNVKAYIWDGIEFKSE